MLFHFRPASTWACYISALPVGLPRTFSTASGHCMRCNRSSDSRPTTHGLCIPLHTNLSEQAHDDHNGHTLRNHDVHVHARHHSHGCIHSSFHSFHFSHSHVHVHDHVR